MSVRGGRPARLGTFDPVPVTADRAGHPFEPPGRRDHSVFPASVRHRAQGATRDGRGRAPVADGGVHPSRDACRVARGAGAHAGPAAPAAGGPARRRLRRGCGAVDLQPHRGVRRQPAAHLRWRQRPGGPAGPAGRALARRAAAGRRGQDRPDGRAAPVPRRVRAALPGHRGGRDPGPGAHRVPRGADRRSDRGQSGAAVPGRARLRAAGAGADDSRRARQVAGQTRRRAGAGEHVHRPRAGHRRGRVGPDGDEGGRAPPQARPRTPGGCAAPGTGRPAGERRPGRTADRAARGRRGRRPAHLRDGGRPADRDGSAGARRAGRRAAQP